MHNIETAAAPLLPLLPACAWLPWAAVPRDNGKLDKVPTCGSRTNAPETWFTLSSALEFLVQESSVAGIGFTIPPGLIALDFDNCRDLVTGDLTDEAQIEIERMNSFAYVTPSRRGFRVIGKNNSTTPIRGGKRHLTLPGGTRVEVFIGPTNHFVTFTHEIINGFDAVRDISTEVLDYFVGLPSTEDPTVEKKEPQRGIAAIRAALGQIPNEHQNWEHWSYIGMATWRSSGGSEEGKEAWATWSSKHPCHVDGACDERWAHWFRSPPSKLGFGTLYYLARQANPLFVPPFDNATYHDPSSDLNDRTTPDNSGQRQESANSDIFPTLDIAGLFALPPLQWLIDGVITTDGFSITYGPPGSLKTFLVLDQALHICAGRPWQGREVKSGKVLYVAGEGVRGIARRVRAWCLRHEVDHSTLPFRLLPASVNLSQPEQVKKLIRTAVAQMEEDGECVAMVVIDTVARSIPGLDENSAQEMGLFVAAVEEIKTGISCHLSGVHHSGKDENRGARGSNALLGAVDTMIRCTREDERLTVTIEKQKDDDEGAPILLRAVPVEWLEGLKPVKSLVLIGDGVKPAPPPEKPDFLLRQVATLLGTNGRMVVNQVANALGLSGRKRHEFSAAIPLAPDYVNVSITDETPPVRLSRTRLGQASNSPVEVVRYDVY